MPADMVGPLKRTRTNFFVFSRGDGPHERVHLDFERERLPATVITLTYAGWIPQFNIRRGLPLSKDGDTDPGIRPKPAPRIPFSGPIPLVA